MIALDPRKLFADDRLSAMCAYCGARPNTRDHVPSRVLLDEPFPDNLPVVQACDKCNNSFSVDEPYLACLVDCVIAGSTNPSCVARPKVKRLLLERPSLATEIGICRSEDSTGLVRWAPNVTRVSNVVVKLARGHFAFQCSELMLEAPSRVSIAPLETLSKNELQEFETPVVPTVSPELGSRAFLNFVVYGRGEPILEWETVQEGRYRYLVSHSYPPTVRFVLSEYLGCEVAWEE